MGQPGPCIVIDARERVVRTGEYDGTNQCIYKLGRYECFDVIKLNEQEDKLFVDDNGLLNREAMDFFGIEGYGQPLAGNGVILGTNKTEDGDKDAGPVKCDLLWVRKRLWWIKAFPYGPCLMLKAVRPPCVSKEVRRTRLALPWSAACKFLAEGWSKPMTDGLL
jgi:hypothetical protein